MSSPQIRLTTWPPGPSASLPDVTICDVITRDDPPHLVYRTTSDELRPVPDELVFSAFLDLDVENIDAIAAFEREHGGGGTAVPYSVDHYAEHYPVLLDEPIATYSPLDDAPDDYADRILDDMRESAVDERTTLLTDWTINARALRACVHHLDATSDADPDRAVRAAWRSEGFAVRDANDGARWFAIVVNERLRPFHLLVLPPGYEDERQWFPRITLENVLALQLRNHCTSRFHRCENELCQHVFPVGTDGRKRRNYCSPQCAKRQGVRNARRREKELAR